MIAVDDEPVLSTHVRSSEATRPLGRRTPKLIAEFVLLILVLWIVGDEINVLWGPGTDRSVVFGTVAYDTVLQLAALVCIGRGVLYATRRRPWIAIGLGCMVWGIGDICYDVMVTQMKEVPIPSLADGFYLSFYPRSLSAWFCSSEHTRGAPAPRSGSTG